MLYLKQMKKGSGFGEYLAVFLALVFAFLNIFHILPPLFKIPPGISYLAIGHYGYDYLGYLALIKQGLAGDFLAVNQFAGEKMPGYWVIAWPYLLAGQVGRLFSFSAPLVYWLSVFLLTGAILLAVYFLISFVCREKKFLVFPVFLSFIFASPFFKIKNLKPFLPEIYRLTWYSEATFLDRLSVIPHHLLAIFLTLGLFLASVFFWQEFFQKKPLNLKIWLKFFPIVFLFVLIMTLWPIRIVYLFPAFIFSFAWGFFAYRLKDKQKLLTGSGMVLFLAFVLLGSGLYFKQNVAAVYSPELVSWEKSQMEFPSLGCFFLATGPVFIFGWLGLIFLILKKVNLPLVLFFGLLASFLSYFLFFTPVSLFFNNHNSRFIFSEAYLFLSLTLFFALEKILPKKNFRLLWLFVVLLAIFSFPSFFQVLRVRIKSLESVSPIHFFLDKEILAGFQFLDRLPGEKIVLTPPSSDFGVVLPAFTKAKVFLGYWPATTNYQQKLSQAQDFYNGKMSNSQQKEFLTKNGINYIILTAYDFSEKPLFLSSNSDFSLIFSNPKIQIFVPKR